MDAVNYLAPPPPLSNLPKWWLMPRAEDELQNCDTQQPHPELFHQYNIAAAPSIRKLLWSIYMRVAVASLFMQTLPRDVAERMDESTKFNQLRHVQSVEQVAYYQFLQAFFSHHFWEFLWYGKWAQIFRW